VRWHRFLNAYVDEIEVNAQRLIAHKFETTTRQNAKGRGFHTFHTQVLDLNQTNLNIAAFLETIEFVCTGPCGLKWNVPCVVPRPTRCGFC
jgi:hypothetical protein